MLKTIIKSLLILIIFSAVYSYFGLQQVDAQTIEIERTRIIFKNSNPTRWEVKAWYYRNKKLRTQTKGYVPSGGTFTWQLNGRPEVGDQVKWLTSCVDPVVDVNLNSTHYVVSAGVALYDTEINISCRNIVNQIYAGCGTNGHTRNFGSVPWTAGCPSNTIYCTKGGKTTYPKSCTGNYCSGCDRRERYCNYRLSRPWCDNRLIQRNASQCGGDKIDPPGGRNESASCTSPTKQEITFSWNARNNASNYEMQFKRSNQTWSQATTVKTTRTSITRRGFDHSTTYDWRVRANSCKTGDWSGIRSVTTGGGSNCTDPPTGRSSDTSCTTYDSSRIRLFWNPEIMVAIPNTRSDIA